MADLPTDVIEDAVRLTRAARRADESTATPLWDGPRERLEDPPALLDDRQTLLEEHGYAARVREDPDGPTLVCYPLDWLDEDGTVQIDRVTDPSEAVEVPLGRRALQRDWEAVEAYNRAVVEAVREEYGSPHGETAGALADFLGNHHATRIDEATADQLDEFRNSYFPRNAWPSSEQQAALDDSLEYTVETAQESESFE